MRIFSGLFLAFVIVPLIELFLLIKLGTAIGAVNTVFIVIITGGLGAWLAKTQGVFILFKIREELNSGIIPKESLIEGVLILAAGLVLLTPGLVTDTGGFLLLIPAVRARILRFIKKKLSNRFSKKQERIY
ncbi:MAG: FxsA family protein [Chitinivibrionales bacterium]